MNLAQVTKLTEEEAREYLEKLRWPNGPYCPRLRLHGSYQAGRQVNTAGRL